MESSSGIVYTHTDLRAAIRSFALVNLGHYSDLFDGTFGTSFWDPTARDVLGLRHARTGACYLFDFPPSDPYFFGDEGEYTIVGQLLDEFIEERETDYDSIKSPNSALGQIMEGPYDSGDSLTITLSSGVYTLVDDAAVASTFQGSVFEGLIEGQGVYVRDATDTNLYHILRVSSVSADTNTLTATQVGALNNGVVSTSLLTAHVSNLGRLQRILFSVDIPVPRENTGFGRMPASMWAGELETADIQDGYFPRSTRLDFSQGLSYWFYGNADLEDDYFHIVLQSMATNARTHWWLGRLTGPSSALTTGTSAAGMFLATSGPYTDSLGADSYQYPMQFGTAESASVNPSIVVTPVLHSNGVYQKDDPDIYTGTAEYSINFEEGAIDGWAASGATLTQIPGAVEIESTSNDPRLAKTGMTIDPDVASHVRFAVRRTTAGDAGNTGNIFFQTDTDAVYDVAKSVTWDATALHEVLNEWWVIEADLSGVDEWDGTIEAIRIDFPAGTVGGDFYEVAWIRVDDGDMRTSDGGVRAFELAFGGVNEYGPGGANHDARYGPSAADFQTLDTSRYSIQAGLNGFNGPFTFGMQNHRDRTFHAKRPNGIGQESGIAPATAQYMARFAPSYSIMYECPFDTVRDGRQTPDGGNTDAQENARYMGTDSFYMYLGQVPGVFRGSLIAFPAVGAGPRSTPLGEVTFDQFPITQASIFSSDRHPETITASNSGMACLVYPR